MNSPWNRSSFAEKELCWCLQNFAWMLLFQIEEFICHAHQDGVSDCLGGYVLRFSVFSARIG